MTDEVTQARATFVRRLEQSVAAAMSLAITATDEALAVSNEVDAATKVAADAYARAMTIAGQKRVLEAVPLPTGLPVRAYEDWIEDTNKLLAAVERGELVEPQEAKEE